jgi:hypothetical protein
MIVKCIFTSYEQIPSLIYEHGFNSDTKLSLTAGKLYAVYSFLYGGFQLKGSNSVQYFIVNDLQFPSFYPACLFEIVCPHLYGDGWCFNHQLIGNDFLIDAILGYEELATDSQYFDEVVLRNIENKKFQQWKILIDKAMSKAICSCNVILESTKK